jgi:uncharacterized protein with PQ loop repeat
MQHQSTQHHIHRRKREHVKRQQYPHPNKYVRFLDKVCLVFSVLMPLTAVPQIWKIFAERNAQGLSLLMWVLCAIGAIPFLIYGIVHKEKQLIILNALWFIMEVIVVSGILVYG